jgi:hypothetical protein
MKNKIFDKLYNIGGLCLLPLFFLGYVFLLSVIYIGLLFRIESVEEFCATVVRFDDI